MWKYHVQLLLYVVQSIAITSTACDHRYILTFQIIDTVVGMKLSYH